MKPSKIMRGFCILLLPICISVWILSYFWTVSAGCFGHQRHEIAFQPGVIRIIADIPGLVRGSWSCRWYFDIQSYPVYGEFLIWPRDAIVNFCGFYLGTNPTNLLAGIRVPNVYCVCVPFWFLTLLSALPSLWMWHKRRTINHGTEGFPVMADTSSPPLQKQR